MPRQYWISRRPLTVDQKPETQRNQLELSQNEMMKQFKGLKGKSHTQEEAERSVNGLGEALNLTFCKLKYVTILLTLH